MLTKTYKSPICHRCTDNTQLLFALSRPDLPYDPANLLSSFASSNPAEGDNNP
jgi:hypothetical protein